jgi:hypothetical protein
MIRYAAGMRTHSAFAAVAAAVTLGALLTASACSSEKAKPHATRVSDAEAPALLINRNWIDRMPESHADRLHVFRFVPTMGGGVYQDRTLFKGTFELFTFAATGDEIRFSLPETRQKVRAHYTIEAVDGPAPFDLRLSIPDSPRGPKVYYSWRGETDRDGSLLESKLSALRTTEAAN